MNLQSNDFALFDVPERFTQAGPALDAQWKTLQRQAHPDRFAAQGAAAQRVAMQWSVRINEAYRRLKDPLRRAAYLCELNGAPVNAEDNTAMPPAFLAQQMEWREALDDAHSTDALSRLEAEVAATQATLFAELTDAIDERRDFPTAVATVRALMFVERFADDVRTRAERYAA